MAAISTIVAAFAVAGAVGTAAVQQRASGEAASETRKAGRRQTAETRRLEADVEEQETQARGRVAGEAASRRRRAAAATAAPARGSTLLTGPLGLPNEVLTGGRTLLGV